MPRPAGCNYYPGYSGQATLPLFVLHRVGFTLPPRLPSERWALTPPFHPYPCGRFLFCGTFRQPNLTSGCPGFHRARCLEMSGLSSAQTNCTATTRTRTARPEYTIKREIASLKYEEGHRIASCLLDVCSDLPARRLLLKLSQRHGGVVMPPTEWGNFTGAKGLYIGNFCHNGELESNEG